MIRTWPGAALALLAIVAFNAYRQGGSYALRSWFSKIFLGRPLDRPEIGRGARTRRQAA